MFTGATVVMQPGDMVLGAYSIVMDTQGAGSEDDSNVTADIDPFDNKMC